MISKRRIKSENMRIDLVTVGIPHRTEGASQVVFFQYIKALIERGYKVRCILVAPTDQKTEYDNFCAEIKKVGKTSIVFIGNSSPIISVNRFSVKVNMSLSRSLEAVLLKEKANLLLLFDIRAALIAPVDFPIKRIVWLGDLGSEIEYYQGILNLRHNFFMSFLKMFGIFIRVIYWNKIYRMALRDVNRVIVGSYSSIDRLSRLGVKSLFLPYPWPIPFQIQSRMVRELPSKPTFLMYGNLKGLGWRSQWDFLFSKLYPELKRVFGKEGFKIDIGGIETPPGWLHKKVESIEEIEFHGLIPDLYKQLSKSHAVIVPLGVPVGNRSRIITAFAGKCPVVAHRNAAVGNPLLVDSYNSLLAESAQEFVAHLALLVSDKQLSQLLIKNAEISYDGAYHPAKANEMFLELVDLTLRD
jgi:hypothetical protein